MKARFACFARPLLALVLAGGCMVHPAFAESEWRAYTTAGGQAPKPLSLADLSGAKVDLQDLRGHVVMLNFWATWCEPCRAEMPALSRLQQKYAKRGLKVIGVNVGEGRARIEQFLHSVPVAFPIARDDDSAVSKAWRVRVLPATFLIDRNGMLRYQMVGEASWDDPKVQAQIAELLE